MDFYFQEGQFNNGVTDWLNICIQLIGFGVTILAAYWGAKSAINLQIHKEEKEKIVELNDRFNFLCSLAPRAYKSIENQVVLFEEFFKKIEEKPSLSHEHSRIALDDVKRLLNLLNEEKTLKAFLLKFSNHQECYEIYNKLIFLLDYYYNGMNSFIENIQLTSKEIQENRELFSMKLRDFQNKIVLLDNIPEYKNTEILFQINALMNSHPSKEQLEDIEFVFNNFINPIQNLLNQLKGNNELPVEAIMIGRDCFFLKKRIINNNLDYAKFFRERYLEFNSNLLKIRPLISYLEKKI